MNGPRIIREIRPTTGPVLSPIETDERGLILRTGATLPPVCVLSGAVLDLGTAPYVLKYCVVRDPNGPRGNNQRASARASVRVVVAAKALAARRKMLVLAGVVTLAVLACLCYFAYPMLGGGQRSSSLIMLCGSLGFSTVLGLAGMLKNDGVGFGAEELPNGSFRLLGIKPHIRQKMLDWQSQHPKLYTHP